MSNSNGEGRFTVHGLVVTGDKRILEEHDGNELFQVTAIKREVGLDKRPVPSELTVFSMGSGRTVTYPVKPFRPYNPPVQMTGC